METLELFERIGLALAIGFLIGIERGWQERAGAAGSRVAGLRTFALIGLLGGISAALLPFVGEAGFGLIALGFAVGFTAFQWRLSVAEDNLSATELVAGLVAFSLGAYAVVGSMALASAAAVAATALLAFREPLHAFLQKLTWQELRAALLLLAMTFVLLPLLPDRTVDPWDALNPYQLWLMTVLIAALSYAGYVAVRVAGERQGLLYAGALGAIVSSTAVTVTYARLGARQPEAGPAVSVGILVAWIVSLLRMTAVALVLAPIFLAPLIAPIAAAAAVLAAFAVVFYRRAASAESVPSLALSNPFELGEVLRFGLLLVVVVFVAKLLTGSVGEMGLVPLAAVSGTVDVDPITITAARNANMANIAISASLILVAGCANLVTKMIIGAVVSGMRFALWLGLSGGLAIAAGAAAFWLGR